MSDKLINPLISNEEIHPTLVKVSIFNIFYLYIIYQIFVFLAFGAFRYFVINERYNLIFIQYLYPLCMVVIPIYLIKKHKLSWNTLGLRKAKYSEIFLGIFVALIYVALVRISPFWKSLNFNKLDIENNYFYLVFLFISVSGFPKVILSPICEEIFYRGLIFGVFREKFPKPISLIFQSLVFSLAHISWVHFRIVDSLLIFVCGMIFGVLYESTKSLYPAMVCHGLINYFSLILSFVNI